MEDLYNLDTKRIIKPWDLLLELIDRKEKEVTAAVTLCVSETLECIVRTSTMYLASKNNLMNTP